MQLWLFVFHIKGKVQTEGFRQWGAQDNIWNSEGKVVECWRELHGGWIFTILTPFLRVSMQSNEEWNPIFYYSNKFTLKYITKWEHLSYILM